MTGNEEDTRGEAEQREQGLPQDLRPRDGGPRDGLRTLCHVVEGCEVDGDGEWEENSVGLRIGRIHMTGL